jgi:hypothetical protein
MKKRYRLTIDISVDVNEKVKGKGSPKLLGHIQQFLKTISKNENALRDYCTHYFTDLLLNGQCFEKLFDLWDTKDMPELLDILDLKNELTPDAADFSKMIYSKAKKKPISDDVCVKYKDLIADQFFMPEIIHAEKKDIEK